MMAAPVAVAPGAVEVVAAATVTIEVAVAQLAKLAACRSRGMLQAEVHVAALAAGSTE